MEMRAVPKTNTRVVMVRSAVRRLIIVLLTHSGFLTVIIIIAACFQVETVAFKIVITS